MCILYKLVQRSLVGSALARCIAGPSSNLREVFPSQRQAMKKMERGIGEWRWMNVLYESDYDCMKMKRQIGRQGLFYSFTLHNPC
jgi:hypothetical protein